MAEKLADWTIAQMKAPAPRAAKTMHQRVMVVCSQHLTVTAALQNTQNSIAVQSIRQKQAPRTCVLMDSA